MHPAKFNDDVLAEARELLRADAERKGKRWSRYRVLDPFAGVGKIHLIGAATYGIEIEREWAWQNTRTLVGSALHVPWRAHSFDAICTSPCYGNRMADTHNAQERCKPCGGTGRLKISWANGRTGSRRCGKCNGTGRRDHHRNTYRHQLGRPLSTGSSAGLQWGREYRDFHVLAWTEALRVLRPNGLFVLNIKDHVRGGHRQLVTKWHTQTLVGMGLTEQCRVRVRTTGNGDGSNNTLRVPFESVIAFRKGAA